MEERGYFWLIETDVPEGRFAPESGTYGTLKISRSGRITLEMDGFLQGFKEEARGEKPTHHTVAGKLRSDGRSVVIFDVISAGKHLSSYSISYEKYVGLHCIISKSEVNKLKTWVNKVSRLQVDLGGYEEWLDVRPIKVYSDKNNINIDYSPPEDRNYRLPDREITLRHDLLGPWFQDTHRTKTKLKQQSSFITKFDKDIPISQAAVEAGRHHDLLIVLTNYAVRLDWPCVYGDGDDNPAILYYIRAFKSEQKFEWHRSWTRLNDLADVFERILTAWFMRYDEIGPGFYMYTSTRRGTHMYSEQRFMSLIWGLEALHRSCKITGTDKKIEEKVQRILSKIDGEDREWLARRLIFAAEFSLSRRLSGMISDIGLDIPSKAVNVFCDKCAKLRNELSHFGRIDRAIERNAAHEGLGRIIPALSSLYHARILIEIGVPHIAIARALHEPMASGQPNWYLRNVGLTKMKPKVAGSAKPRSRRGGV